MCRQGEFNTSFESVQRLRTRLLAFVVGLLRRLLVVVRFSTTDDRNDQERPPSHTSRYCELQHRVLGSYTSGTPDGWNCMR